MENSYDNNWVKEFLDCLLDQSHENMEILKSQAIKLNNLPKSIFKYRPDNKNSINNLETDTVWLTSANHYNDPYDSSVTLDFRQLLNNIPTDDIKELVDNAGVRNYLNEIEIETANKTASPIDAIFQKIMDKDPNIKKDQQSEILKVLHSACDHIMLESLEDLNNYMQKGIKICSFSTNSSSLIMWGHYSSSHTGFCIEYDLTQIAKFEQLLLALYPVIYSNGLFDATKYFNESMKKKGFNNLFGILAALHKSPEWSYEEEWRLVLPLGPEEPSRDYQMPTPKAIYLGSRMSEENKNKVAKIAISKGITIYEMRLSTSKFELESKDVTDKFKIS